MIWTAIVVHYTLSLQKSTPQIDAFLMLLYVVTKYDVSNVISEESLMSLDNGNEHYARIYGILTTMPAHLI